MEMPSPIGFKPDSGRKILQEGHTAAAKSKVWGGTRTTQAPHTPEVSNPGFLTVETR